MMAEYKDYLGTLLEIKNCYLDYTQKEIESTESDKIRAEIAISNELLKNKIEVREIFANKFFNERKELMNMANCSLEKAIQLGDIEVAEVILQFINTIYEKNIFEMRKNI